MSSRLCWLYKRPVTDSHSGLRGLTNFCLSCCVNTLLQTFSATWELTDLLDKWETAGARTDAGRNIPLQLKRFLGSMRSDLAQPAPHHDFLRCLDRNSFRLNTQHDADEVFLAILNFMQQQMDDKSLALEIQNLYKISVETYVQCLVCSSIQTRTSYLLNLPLPVKEDRDSLELRDMNCCFCPKCETKTPSKQGLKLLSLPQILCLNLKRFRNSRDETRKLDCVVTFPETFDFSETLNGAFSSDFAQQNDCKYTLYAVVVHSGYAMFGHYTAFVRRNQCWYYADDSHVKQVSWEEVSQTYGGRYRDTAYILMYRRGSKEEGQQPEFSG